MLYKFIRFIPITTLSVWYFALPNSIANFHIIFPLSEPNKKLFKQKTALKLCKQGKAVECINWNRKRLVHYFNFLSLVDIISPFRFSYKWSFERDVYIKGEGRVLRGCSFPFLEAIPFKSSSHKARYGDFVHIFWTRTFWFQVWTFSPPDIAKYCQISFNSNIKSFW